MLLLVVGRVLVSSTNPHNLRQQGPKPSRVGWSGSGVERVLGGAGGCALQPVLGPEDWFWRGGVWVDVSVVLAVALARHLPRDGDDGGVGELENPVDLPGHHIQCSLWHQTSALELHYSRKHEKGWMDEK